VIAFLLVVRFAVLLESERNSAIMVTTRRGQDASGCRVIPATTSSR